jgi:hypothetical protein
VDHDPQALLELLAVSSQKDARPLVLISQSVALSAEKPRVKGTTTVLGTAPDGALEVATKYVVVYPFDVPDRGVGSRVAGVHQRVTWRMYDPSKSASENSGLWLFQIEEYYFNRDP